MSADAVAKDAYRQLMKNRGVVLPGVRNKIMQLFPAYIKMMVIAGMKKSEDR